MNFRIQSDELPVSVLEAVGFMANHGVLEVAGVRYDAEGEIVSFPLDRLPVTGNSLLAVTRHAKSPVRCNVTFRNVTDCRIGDRTGGMDTVELIFGLKIDSHEIYLSSAAEDRGEPCFEMTCRVSAIDIEIKDEEAAPTMKGFHAQARAETLG